MATFEYALPQSITSNLEVKRVDADGLHDVDWNFVAGKLEIQDNAPSDRIYILTLDTKAFDSVELKRQKALEIEQLRV
jgi:hypothetical protein